MDVKTCQDLPDSPCTPEQAAAELRSLHSLRWRVSALQRRLALPVALFNLALDLLDERGCLHWTLDGVLIQTAPRNRRRHMRGAWADTPTERRAQSHG